MQVNLNSIYFGRLLNFKEYVTVSNSLHLTPEPSETYQVSKLSYIFKFVGRLPSGPSHDSSFRLYRLTSYEQSFAGNIKLEFLKLYIKQEQLRFEFLSTYFIL